MAKAPFTSVTTAPKARHAPTTTNVAPLSRALPEPSLPTSFDDTDDIIANKSLHFDATEDEDGLDVRQLSPPKSKIRYRKRVLSEEGDIDDEQDGEVASISEPMEKVTVSQHKVNVPGSSAGKSRSMVDLFSPHASASHQVRSNIPLLVQMLKLTYDQ